VAVPPRPHSLHLDVAETDHTSAEIDPGLDPASRRGTRIAAPGDDEQPSPGGVPCSQHTPMPLHRRRRRGSPTKPPITPPERHSPNFGMHPIEPPDGPRVDHAGTPPEGAGTHPDERPPPIAAPGGEGPIPPKGALSRRAAARVLIRWGMGVAILIVAKPDYTHRGYRTIDQRRLVRAGLNPTGGAWPPPGPAPQRPGSGRTPHPESEEAA